MVASNEHFHVLCSNLLSTRKARKAQREAELHALSRAWRVPSKHGLLHQDVLLKPKCSNKQVKDQTTSQNNISTWQQSVGQLPLAKTNAVDVATSKHAQDQQLLLNSECRSVLKHLLLSVRPTASDEEESLCITPARTCKHVWQHGEVPLRHNPVLYTPNILRFSSDCQHVGRGC